MGVPVRHRESCVGHGPVLSILPIPGCLHMSGTCRQGAAVSEGEPLLLHAWNMRTAPPPAPPPPKSTKSPPSSFNLCLQAPLLPFLLTWHASCDPPVLAPLSSCSSSQSTFLALKTGLLFLFCSYRCTPSTFLYKGSF